MNPNWLDSHIKLSDRFLTFLVFEQKNGTLLSYVWHKIWTEDIISGRLQRPNKYIRRKMGMAPTIHNLLCFHPTLSFSFSFSYNTLPAVRFHFKIAPKGKNNGDIIIKCWQSLIPTLKPYHLYIIQAKSSLKMIISPNN